MDVKKASSKRVFISLPKKHLPALEQYYDLVNCLSHLSKENMTVSFYLSSNMPWTSRFPIIYQDHGLFVTDLIPHINEGYLKAYFREWGTVTACKVKTEENTALFVPFVYRFFGDLGDLLTILKEVLLSVELDPRLRRTQTWQEIRPWPMWGLLPRMKQIEQTGLVLITLEEAMWSWNELSAQRLVCVNVSFSSLGAAGFTNPISRVNAGNVSFCKLHIR